MKPKTILTKTDFISYLDAPRHLWAIKHGKLEKQKINTYLKHLFKQGYQVEELAEQYIKKHLIPKYGVSDNEILLQPTQSAGNYEARADILVKNPKTNKWDMYEIKSSTKVDRIHKYDATFQTLVFEKYYDLGDIYILHLNDKYYRKGDIDLTQLFIAENMNLYVKKIKNEVLQKRHEAYLIAKATNNMQSAPACIRPKKCPCLNLCHPNLPKYSIFDINRITQNTKKIQALLDNEIVDIMDVPKKFKLTDIQRLQVNVAQSGITKIQHKAIKKSLNKLVYPLYFLDYESFNPAIPMYDGYKPYDQMCFQYSLHILKEPNRELEHYEFVETKAIDPIPNLLNSLQKVIGTKGSIIVWNKSFEATQNSRMGEIHPQYADFTKNMNSRIYDLMDIFKNQLYADPKFKGSYSIKKVLPVLVPELSYAEMDIGDGATAMASWNEMVHGNTTNKEKEIIKKDLLKYCKLDTLAMVKIWQNIHNNY